MSTARASSIAPCHRRNSPEETDVPVPKIWGSAPLILRAIKEITIHDPEMNSEDRLRFAETLSKQLRQRAGAKEGFTTFREKRQPAWQGS
jgi:enoyl-CoA hydratase/carnithine racemase